MFPWILNVFPTFVWSWRNDDRKISDVLFIFLNCHQFEDYVLSSGFLCVYPAWGVLSSWDLWIDIFHQFWNFLDRSFSFFFLPLFITFPFGLQFYTYVRMLDIVPIDHLVSIFFNLLLFASVWIASIALSSSSLISSSTLQSFHFRHCILFLECLVFSYDSLHQYNHYDHFSSEFLNILISIWNFFSPISLCVSLFNVFFSWLQITFFCFFSYLGALIICWILLML